MAEVKISGAVPAAHASRLRARSRNLGDVRVAWPHDGSQREKGDGETLASKYKPEGLAMLPQHATQKPPQGAYRGVTVGGSSRGGAPRARGVDDEHWGMCERRRISRR